jgi:hypothetical protein
VRLDRGPTPEKPSFEISRQTIAIVGATSGSNSEAARLSFDDNEITSWTSRGELPSAWIEYQLERPATISEAAFKLTGWRERSYPVRILVDGTEVYRGLTTRSLGYVTLPLKPTRGERVRIELVGAGSAGDAFAIAELEDARNAATGSARVKANALSIIEAEFYEAVKK